MEEKLVAYYRVSTKRQGESGLGLDAQREAVNNYACSDKKYIVAEYTEIETGKNSNRPELRKAIEYSKRHKATLVIAKLDRLARNVSFTAALMESGVSFVCCDNPHATRLTLHILSAVAEDEARRIAERTKAALAQAKKRGVLLGSSRPGHWEGREHLRTAGRLRGSEVAAKQKKLNSLAMWRDVIPVVREMRGQGMSLQEIGDELQSRGISPARAKEWSPCSVRRLLMRAEG